MKCKALLVVALLIGCASAAFGQGFNPGYPTGGSGGGSSAATQSAPGTSATTADTIQGAANGVPVPTVSAGSANAAASFTPSVASAASALVAKAAPGNLYNAYAKNTTTSAGYLIAYNATAAPASGASLTPAAILECVFVPASGIGAITYNSGPPERFSTGVVLLVSSTDCAIASPVYTTGTVTAFLHASVL